MGAITEITFARWHNEAYKKIAGNSDYRPSVPPICSKKDIFEGLKNSHKFIRRKFIWVIVKSCG